MSNDIRGGFALFVALIVGVGCSEGPREVGVETTAKGASALNTTLKDSQFSDANGWNTAPYYSTIDFPDINGDSASDVCGRGFGGVWCAVDDGTGTPDFLTKRSTEGQGLSGSAADRLARGDTLGASRSTAPDPELAGLVTSGTASTMPL